jgi:hypothetical protein
MLFIKRSFTEHSVIIGPHKMSTKPKQIIDDAMAGYKSLSVPLRFETPHLSFLLPGWLMGKFTAIIFILLSGVFYTWHQLSFRC